MSKNKIKNKNKKKIIKIGLGEGGRATRSLQYEMMSDLSHTMIEVLHRYHFYHIFWEVQTEAEKRFEYWVHTAT
jgi:hypothetical protein